MPLAAFAAALSATPAPAQDYPNRTIRIIVQTQPGGLIDQIGRTLAQKLSENTGADGRGREPHRRRRR